MAADAIAAMPFPSPVRPIPSVVVASNETDAPPSAFDSASIASILRGPNFGRLAITCTDTCEIV